MENEILEQIRRSYEIIEYYLQMIKAEREWLRKLEERLEQNDH